MIKNLVKAFFITLILLGAIIVGDYYYSLYQSNKRMIEAGKIDPTSWDLPYQDMQIKEKYKIVILTTYGGEWTHGVHLKKAAENLGWEAKLLHKSFQGYENEILQFDPDFILFSIGINYNIDHRIGTLRAKIYGIYYYPIEPNMHVIWPKEQLFDKDLKPRELLYKLVKTSDGLLINDKKIKIFEEYYKQQNKNFYAINIVPSISSFDFKPTNPKHITIIGHSTDNIRNGNKFKTILTRLDKDDILKTYGRFEDYNYIPKSYQGYISNPFDVLDVLNRNGIALICHAKFNFDSGNPSTRIMEAFAANALVITDKNPFTVKNFGDNVLYFDVDADADTIYKQIKGHYDWAIANPDRAKAMANRAHLIFEDKLSTDRDLVRIAKMHEKILSDEKKMNLEFPFKP